MSKSNLDLYNKNMILPNKHRINYLRISNPFTVDIIFSPPRIICDFIQLETLIFDNIDAKYLNNILKHLYYLPKFHLLSLNFVDYVEDPRTLFHQIFRLPKLKSCKLTYKTKNDQQPMPIYLTEFTHSPIEYFEINNRFSIDSLGDILLCLPKLRYLTIDCLVGHNNPYIEEEPIALEYLKYVSIKFDNLRFYFFKELIKQFFGSVEVLRLTTDDSAYLNVEEWEKLILSSMSNLNIFDIDHFSISENDTFTAFLLACHSFDCSFWTDRKWFIKYQHVNYSKLDCIKVYSTKPYRRKDYIFSSEFEYPNYPYTREYIYNSVKHVHIRSEYVINNSKSYFPNADQLIIEKKFKRFGNFISTALNGILPLKQLNALIIEAVSITFEQLIKLIHCTPNLHTLKFQFILLSKSNGTLIEQNEIFQQVSNTNKITNLELHESCTLENVQMIMKLFPQVEYLKTGMNRKSIHQIIRFLFSKTNPTTRRLYFLCISQIPKVCLRELNMLMKIENLLNAYFIKYINHDLYLWW